MSSDKTNDEISKEVEKIDYNQICNICGDRLGNSPVHTLECNHHFHYECILKKIY